MSDSDDDFDLMIDQVLLANLQAAELVGKLVTTGVLQNNGEGPSNKRPRGPNKERGREEGHDKLIADYFSNNPVYNDEDFKRRFRMTRRLFLRIVNELEREIEYFKQHWDARGVKGFSALQKCTSATLQSKWHMVKRPARVWTRTKLQEIMYTCIILHNMICEDEGISDYPFDPTEVLPEDIETNISEADRARNVNLVKNRERHANLRQDFLNTCGTLCTIISLIREEVSPMKLSHNDAMTKMQQVKKYIPKVMTPKPITPPPSSSRMKKKLSFRRALEYFETRTTPMLVYTNGGYYVEWNYKEEAKKEEELFRQRALSFIASMRYVQGNRCFMGWKGSVVDSIVGAFLSQNTSDQMSSTAFMCLAAKYPTTGINKHALDWDGVRCADHSELSLVIRDGGMNMRMAERIQRFLDSIYNCKFGILDDLEWLRKAQPDKTMEFLSKIYGLGIKSKDCLRLLALRQHAFPVDRHVARIVVRLGWVPITKLPDGVLIHELKEYPKMEVVQEYLSERLSNLDVDTFSSRFQGTYTFVDPSTSKFPLQLENALGPFTPTRGDQSSHVKDRLQDIEDLCKVQPVIKARLRTEHQVYELPDSHPLVQQVSGFVRPLEKRDNDDKNPYLLAIWPRETRKGEEEEEEEMVFGRFLVPCRTATRGTFPLDGTYFQINEVFAEDESCEKPVVVPKDLLSNLTVKTLFCGTSITAIFQGMSSEEIRDCFWKGMVFSKELLDSLRVSSRLYMLEVAFFPKWFLWRVI
ncbi:hypothetical protein OSB04_026863 [Centaurea solstitialis]|uniref:HhH-GPD domain-containing protein n=1 Tax=Centaurea solstitialis TaxID=347529 RepID=A0AA38SW76_9ASTR|nr:hypothetical protein OSB04_026863 [Centaurea solstitialis]